MAELFLIVTIGGERVAIRSAEVECVIEVGAVTPVPGAPRHVAGLTALRSRVLTAVDCRCSLNSRDRIPKPRDALVAHVDGHAYALLVDAAEDVVEGAPDIATPAGLRGGWARVAAGCVGTADGLLLLVDPAALVAGPEAAAALNPPLTNCA